jgi:hypothetical protein
VSLTTSWPWLVAIAAAAGMVLAALWAVLWIVSHSD